MMSDFMFPIYLATNKIQKQRRIRGRTEGTTKRQRSLVPREAHGRPRQTRERGKAKAW